MNFVFRKIQYRLLFSYLTVFALILGTSAILTRIVFARSLNRQLTDKITALGQGAAANTEFENGKLKVESDFSIPNLNIQGQALQWFDLQGHSIAQQGKNILNLPLSVNEPLQVYKDKVQIQAITLPIIDSDDKKLIGYVRVSQSRQEFDETLERLNLGLGIGVAIALILSGVGGILLTRQAMQPIEDSFQRLKQFTADSSHELRSPLMAIKSNAAVALKYPEGMRETDKEKFEAIASASKQMTSLTEDLLFLARNDKVVQPKGDKIDLTSILQDLVQLYQSHAAAKQISLESKLTKDLYLLGDEPQLKRLFINLLENAIYYTPLKGTVEITATSIDLHLIVEVQDTGIGIAPEHLEKVFERFWREDKSRSYNSGGSGLGLAIARTIARNHGGEIKVISEIGVGSCFTVYLPTNSLKT
jgi:two-component system, OmpR family, manganese sensing sensor histidine kinase